ncbi:winged helix-turn-helix domain-containing tetratricopeptide repeat protein [Pseudogemmobacter sp. W21_MBD1_M6]|uniref:winged helix-turn-helix domain-containing tetratricopeptide repeat protein n=1 Tax=Pseudogemmobacter sp. W21_MBD1_M6 TaxID=3240271 RepID=UPI003F987DE2
MMEVLRFLDFELRPALRSLTRQGRDASLGARAFDLLCFLIDHRSRVVGRAELIEAVWAGLAVGDNNLNVQVSTLRKLLGHGAIITVPNRGLRFGLEIEINPQDERHKVALPLPDRPSVAILLFLDLSDGSIFEWFADGVAEDITTELSRFRGLFVVARNSAFIYRGQAIDVRCVSRDLGVRYIVEGSVRPAGPKMRVTAQLIDAVTGAHVWAERFDRRLEDQGDVQDEVARAIVMAIAPQIDGAEDRRASRAPPNDPSADGLARHAWAISWPAGMTYDRALRDDAQQLAGAALDRDADCALAHCTLAMVQWWHAYHGTTACRKDTVASGLDSANRAIALNSGDHHAWRIKGLLHVMAGEPEASLLSLRRAHEINPNCAITLAWLGLYEAMNGDAAKGVHYAQSALRHSPLDPSRGSLLVALGFAQFAARDYYAAAATVADALQDSPRAAVPYVLAAICYVAVGQWGQARAAFDQLQDIAPALAKERLDGLWLATNEDYRRRAHLAFRIAAGLEDIAAAAGLH